jgi:PIN domain nuclease of toxin-antitoxin system
VSLILLDTHIFLWWAHANRRIQASWVEEIVADTNTVFLSAVSAWEIETKKRTGKLDFDDEVEPVASKYNFTSLPMTTKHASLAGSIDWDHKDPFDRILVAQALLDDMILISADAIMKSAPGVRVL